MSTLNEQKVSHRSTRLECIKTYANKIGFNSTTKTVIESTCFFFVYLKKEEKYLANKKKKTLNNLFAFVLSMCAVAKNSLLIKLTIASVTKLK